MSPLREVAWVFFKLGATAFGGPAAHIALMQDEIVRRRAWVTAQEFTDLLGATNLIPGPNSTELAIHLGHKRAGWPGLLVAGACFILPAAIITLAFALAYVQWGTVPAATGVLAGLKPAILALIIAVIYRLGRSTLRTPFTIAAAVGAAGCALAGTSELLLLFGAGALGIIRSFERPKPTAALSIDPVTLTGLTWVFAKIGSILYGSGYVLIAFLRRELVLARHWLTESQLLDAVAIGQVTPGPVFTTATFIGFVLGGWPGAVLATAAIFVPSFIFVAASAPLIPRLRSSRSMSGFLDGVNAAALGLMASACIFLAHDALLTWPQRAIGAAAGAVLVLTKVNPTWVLAAAAAVGAAMQLAK